MEQVIGEIGGSSSRWAILSANGTVTTWPSKGERLPGFNPISGNGEAFSHEIREFFKEHFPEALVAGEVHIYGAGCGNLERRANMHHAIRQIWEGAEINVASDLTAAALGLCEGGPGLVLILGTGMNAGYFDGTQLFTPMPSLGYLIGDEGSGADIGRHLVQDAFYGRVPRELHASLFGNGPDLGTLLPQVYGATHPARELAKYTGLLAGRHEEGYVRELILGRFSAMAELLTRFFTAEQRGSVFATGSVAYGFRELLAECLLDRGMALTSVVPDPLHGLVVHHQRPGS
ncbi:MAG: hypothetical protein KBA60_03505 [Flavobacteriales bacterium]|nr:hypothetical protein [Flavobacteriales bacterium]MBP6644104.1 hypothetical protein [Flavobacteriales bacterium]MBP7155049.1 hypothetical protein [Flavobacteriales bacterium]HQV74520.1 hypothetical protein [Flavobacteriales bacterium]HQW40299.1 hypothetical protein [Flavobacteriales bacterium]